MSEVLLVGLGSNAENDVANLELVVAEEGGGSGADQSTGDLQEVRFGGDGDGLGSSRASASWADERASCMVVLG